MKQFNLETASVSSIILMLFCSCSSTKNISGVYYSNFATHGFFVTKLIIRADSTFGYQMRGDVLNDTAKGKYRLVQNRLLLKYDKPVLEKGGYVKIGPKDSILMQAEIIGDRGPRVYLIGHRKLFVADSLGRKMAKDIGYSKYRKFLFWGDNYLLARRCFIKKLK